MFCMKCGAKLEEGAKFCPQCGTPTEQPATAPVSATVLAPPKTPPQPRRSSTERERAGEGPVRQQPQQPYAAAPVPPPYSPEPVKKKKKHTGLVIFLLIIVVLAAGVALKYKQISAYALRNFAPAERYYAHVEKQNISELSANAGDIYDNWVLSNTDADNKTSDGGVELRLGSAGREILMSSVGSTLQQLNPGEDLSWLKSLGIQGDRITQGDKTSMALKLQLNSTTVITLNMFTDLTSEKVYLGVPELTGDYLEMPLSQLQAMGGGSGVMQIVGLLGNAASADNRQMAESLRSLPDKGKIEKLVDKYLNLILECVEEAEKEKTTLTVGGVSADVTALTTSVDGETLAKIVEKVCTEMKTDRDIKDIVVNASEAQEEDGAKAYDNFLKQLDETLGNLSEIKQRSSGFDMTVYVDGKGETVGREFTAGNFTYSIKKPEDGNKFGLELIFGSEGSTLKLSGKGTKSGDKLTGELDMESDGTYLGILALDGLDEAKLKQGMFSGALEIRPSDALVGAASTSPVLSSLLRNFAIRIEMDTAKNNGKATLTILSDGAELLSLASNLDAKSGGRVSAVSGVDMEQWSSNLSPDVLTTIVDALERAGVPDVYTSSIRSLTEN